MPQPNRERPQRNARIIELRRTTPLTTSQIAVKMVWEGYPGTTKNVVIGILQRHAPELMAKRVTGSPHSLQDFPAPGHCLFSKSRTIPYVWCGAETLVVGAWCEEHRKVVFEKPAGKIDLRGIR